MIAADDHRRFGNVVESARTFVLVTHMNPDGDALGAELGLARFLRARGKQVAIVNNDPVPPVLQFLDRGDVPIEQYDPDVHDGRMAAVDRIVLLDNSAPDRLGRLEPRMRELADSVVCIDHHPTRGTIWGEAILDVGSSAAAAMVHELVVGCGWLPDEAAAEALFVGIATDTGFFRYNSTSPEALRICADLMERGVDPAACYRRIYERNSPVFARILGAALADMRLAADGRVVSVRVTRDGLRGAEEVDTSEMMTPLLAIDGVQVALLFRELGDAKVKVSLRSKGAWDVHALALEYGGGGHRNASGIVAVGTLDEVEDRIVERALAMFDDDGADR